MREGISYFFSVIPGRILSDAVLGALLLNYVSGEEH